MQTLYVNCNHPGAVDTELQRHVQNFATTIINSLISITPEDGSVTQMHLATSPEIEEKNIKGKYFVPYGDEVIPNKHSTNEENQIQLWDFTEKILYDKVPGYVGAGI